MSEKVETTETPAMSVPKELTAHDLLILMTELMTAQLRIAAQALESQAKLNDLVIEKMKNGM